MSTSLPASITVRSLSPEEARSRVPELAEILMDCVEGGASVSFMAPLTPKRAECFWLKVAEGVAAGDRVLLVAEETETGRLLGTVQVLLGLPENQPHRAEIAKMLVCRAARRQGIARRLMLAAEAEALVAGRDLLVLDTVTGSPAERLYAGLGWKRVGEIPRFALMPDGEPCSTTFFYRDLRSTSS